MPIRIETLLLGTPFTVTTLLEPGLLTTSKTVPAHVIENVEKCWMGSALAGLAALARYTSASAMAATERFTAVLP
jgi:hypothetical protein